MIGSRTWPNRFFCWVLALAFGPSFLFANPKDRTWTDQKGRSLEGVLSQIQPESVQVILSKDRRPVTIHRQLLSKEDQEYVETWEKLGFGRTVERWPHELKPMLNFTPRLEPGYQPGQWVYSTPNYRFHCDVELAASLIKEYSLAFEGTLYAIRKLPLGLNPKPPEEKFTVRLFQRREDYLRAGGPKGSAGVYLLKSKEILVPMESLGVRTVGNRVAIDRRAYDSGTLVHEITHQVMHEWLQILPVWFVEGFAEYMAAVPFSGARFRFREIHEGILDQLANEYRVQQSRGGHYELDLAPPDQIMSLSHQQWAAAVATGRNAALNYRSAMMLIYFFIHLDGKGDGASIMTYLKQAQEGQDELHSFIAQYNDAVNQYNADLDHYNQSVAHYNSALLRFRKSVEDFNIRVRTYNRQLERGLPPSKLIEVGESPGKPPHPPRKPEMPAILARGNPQGGVVDLAEAELEARKSLIQQRSSVELWNQMSKAFADQKIRIRAVNTVAGRSLLEYGELRATPIREAE